MMKMVDQHSASTNAPKANLMRKSQAETTVSLRANSDKRTGRRVRRIGLMVFLPVAVVGILAFALIKGLGYTAVHQAALVGNPNSAEKHIHVGSKPSMRVNEKVGVWITPADLALNLDSDGDMAERLYGGYPETLEVILEAGGQFNAVEYPLILAMQLDIDAQGDEARFTRVLLAQGLDANATLVVSGLELPILHLAAGQDKSAAIVTAILEAGADSQAMFKGETALEFARRLEAHLAYEVLARWQTIEKAL